MPDVRPLQGIRVFELGIGVAAPVAARYMAHFGAEVIKVESAHQPDILRNIGPGWLPRELYGNRVWMDLGVMLNEANAGKLSVGLDLKSPDGFEAAKRILSRCDVFLSNYSAEALRSLALDYESVRTTKPDIVHLALSGFGDTPDTPYYSYVAWGSNLAALCGLDQLTGTPDEPPLGIANMSYSDYSNAMLGLIALLAALEHRTQTSEGQSIDLSQYEAAVGLVGPALIDYEISGRSVARNGNRLPWAAPQGVYRCRGDDDWVATSVLSESDWQCFCAVAGRSEWLTDSRFTTTEDRLAYHDELDALVTDWTLRHSPTELTEWLQRAGIAASPVLDHARVATDPHLAARDFWLLPDHVRWGKDLASGNPIRLGETPGHVDRAVPPIGQNNEYVLGHLCGYSDSEIEALIARGVVFPVERPDLKIERRYLPWIRHLMPDLPWRGT